MRGKFIVFEGIDGSGKTTQFFLLQKRLEEKGYQVKTLDFPRYEENHFGKLLKRMLEGEFGNIDRINPYLAVLPYMVDQALARSPIKQWLSQGFFVLSNRYFTSNFGHQVGKLPHERWDTFREWLIEAGYNQLGIVKEDVVLFFDTPPDMTSWLLDKRTGKTRDFAEKSKKHQIKSYQAFCEALKVFSHWIRVECVKDGKLLSEKEIDQKVLTILGV